MGWISIVIALGIAAAMLGSLPKLEKTLRPALIAAAAVVLFVGVALSSVRYVSADRVGIVTKNALGSSLTGGRIVATEGEMGVQADVLSPGWQLWYWPVVYNVDLVPLTTIGQGSVGVVEAIDGRPLSTGQVFADEVSPEEFERMIRDSRYFLAEGEGQKGPQTSVLTPGSYRINTKLFNVKSVDQTDVPAGAVAVLKANVGAPPSIKIEQVGDGTETIYLASEGEKGIRVDPLLPGKYPLNPKAYEVYVVRTEQRVANYTLRRHEEAPTFGEIPVKSSDGFTFPVDVRVVYYIKEDNAPRVVALLGGDNDKMQQLLTSRVRAIFRDNAESVKALDYIQQRTVQAQAASRMLRAAMEPYGITIASIDIGEVGDEESLGMLLDTQREREIAIQQQLTFQEQQRAAEQEKELKKTRQEADEEMRLATARYQVQIAEQQKQGRIIEAQAEAESIAIRADAQAEAYRVIAQQIGPSNAALMELMKIVGEQGVNITPRVMVIGDESSDGDAETTALIGTMLDTMVRDDRTALTAADTE